MKRISLITVYNNKELVETMITTSKFQINVDIDYVIIDNSTGKFSSAASALNFGASKAKSEVLVFLHQDIEFLKSDVLEKIHDFACKNKKIIFGAAGVQDKDSNKYPKFLSSMAEGNDYIRYNTLEKPEYAFTLDECLIACHQDCLKKVSFDEQICNGWHLYGADLCLQAQVDDELDVMVLPMDVCHKSHGNADKSYFVTQKKVGRKYKKHFKYINTTNGYVYTNLLMQIIQSFYRFIRY